MRRLLFIFLLPISLMAQTIPVTPNLGLQLIPDGYQNWGVPYRTTMTTIDTWSATVATKQNPVFTGVVTFPITGLTQCLHVNSSGVVSGTGSDCGAGGGSGFPFTLGSTSIGASSTITSITGLTVNSVTPTTFGFLDPTSSVQTQLNSKQATITLTTTGTSGAATLSGGALNIPNYATSGGGTIPNTSNLLTGGASNTAAASPVGVNGSGISLAGQCTSLPSGTHCVDEAGGVARDVPIGDASNYGQYAITAFTTTGTSTSPLVTEPTAGNIGLSCGSGGTYSGCVYKFSTIGLTSTEPIASPSLTITGSGIPISTGSTSNTDLGGYVTLATGTATYTFATTHTYIPIVVCSDTNSTPTLVGCHASTTAITFNGTGSDIISYITIGMEP